MSMDDEVIFYDISSCEDHDSIAKLGNDVSKKIHMNDESNKNDTGDLHKWTFKDEEDEEEDDDLSEDDLLSQMGYAKPESKRGFEEVDGEEENNNRLSESHNVQKTNQAIESSQHQPVIASLPPVSNLVSALKGSRSKQGNPPLELCVSWAPDVYDPVPTSPDQFASKNSDYEQKFIVGPKKCRGKGVREIEEGCYVGEKGTCNRGNRFNKGNDILRSAKGSRKEKDKKQVKRHGRDKKYYSSYSNHEDD